MDFLSDNSAGVHPAILPALAEAAPAAASGYDADRWSAGLDDAFSDLFGTPVRAFAVPSGTAANALSLAACAPSFGGIWCHRDAHVEVDEAGAIPFYSGGASLILVDGADGRLSPRGLDEAAARRRTDVHQVQPAAISITQATEAGTVYAPDDIAAIAGWGRARGLKLHMDGARFANAVVHLGCHPADISWKAGVDILSFGFIKNGGMSAEAICVFDPALAATLPVRRKRAGLMPSKGRFAAAQLLAMLRDDIWLSNARAANTGAARIAAAAPQRLLRPVEANELFLRLSAPERQTLRDLGFSFYDWEAFGPDAARFVVRWDQSGDAIGRLADAIRDLP